MRFRRWDVRAHHGYLTDECGRLALFWTKRCALNRAGFINANAACRGVRARCYIIDRRTWERIETE